MCGLVGLGALLSAGCGTLLPPALPAAATYRLDAWPELGAAGAPGALPSPNTMAVTVTVLPPRAAAGFDSRHLVYSREPHELAHFAHSEWIDTPARMLGPLIVATLEASGRFGAVGALASGQSAGLRLDTEILQLLQDFSVQPSQVHFSLRAALLDSASRRVIATRVFTVSAPAATEDARGGVAAAQQAVRDLLRQLTAFCAEGAAEQAGRAHARHPPNANSK